MNLRVAALAAAVTAAVLLPLAASAGGTGTGKGAGAAGTDATAPPGDLLGGLGLGPGPRTAGDAPAGTAPTRTPTAPPVPPGPPAPVPGGSASAGSLPERIARCGPELASPEGVEAQTCVLAEGADTWGRTYYRNATGRELDAYLTLMAPGGRTVQVRCHVAAEDEPGRCETPRERGSEGLTAYTAVAEFAGAGDNGAGAEGAGPLLLRSGSNTAGGEGS
ncbi:MULTISPECIES: hypothetical protein [unclassified Streptomyces]|uniref:hypothetical protein n=1 Tax=unclassified Streptomyces TaxID=2593676 RepID=UPI0036C0D1B8